MRDLNLQDYFNRRNLDVKGERITSEFLTKYFYPLLGEKVSVNYTTDKTEQVKGLDVTVEADNKKYTIDEKSSFHYYGKDWLKTFSHEINSVNIKNELYNGWLLQTDTLSEYWLYVWVEQIDVNDYTEITSCDNLKHATVALVEKKAVYQLMKDNNINSRALISVVNDLREQGIGSRMYQGFKLTVQQKFRERSANILIPKSILTKIATCSMIYNNGNIEFIDNRK